MKKRGRKRRSGSVETVANKDLGGGLRMEVHRLTPPEDPEILSAMRRALMWAGLGLKGRAAAVARDVWRKAPGDKFVEVWSGQMLAKYGKAEDAVEVYCASEGLEGEERWHGYWALGQFLAAAGLHQRAAEYLREAVRLEPRAVEAYLDLARCLLELGRTAEAEQSLSAARHLDPKAAL